MAWKRQGNLVYIAMVGLQMKMKTIRRLHQLEIAAVAGSGCCFIIEQDPSQLKTKPDCSQVIPGKRTTLPNTDDGRMRCEDMCKSMSGSWSLSHCCAPVFFAHDCEFVPEESFRKVMR
ncbi:hypothetical protein GAMM_60100 [Gammaproteobacteria bacterium]